MLTTILKSLVRSILSRVSEGFSEVALTLGELNNKITVVENEYTTKFAKFDELDAKLSKIAPETMLVLSYTELDQFISRIVETEASVFNRD
ncbi:hypothetical protein UFOVP116_186 [uncultured Caudovirales phage]|uniref:Uncharacterized protein n=1 Tax=uncultured Caudovirales phage TaxID=2100421 RepID=A0A6J5L9D5_9CAUD|nr:hypothetical protein UFOVP116_186 [uncultured Caudovirales phage]